MGTVFEYLIVIGVVAAIMRFVLKREAAALITAARELQKRGKRK